jgi:hypothetical protein
VDVQSLDPEEREQLQPFLPPGKRFVERAAVGEALERATEALAERERLARQAAASIEAESAQKTARLMQEFLDKLSPEERALLGWRLHAEEAAGRSAGDLEREVARLRDAVERRGARNRRRA